MNELLARIEKDDDLDLVKGWLTDLSDKDRQIVIYMCTFDTKTYRFPKFDSLSAFELALDPRELELLENDANIMRRIYAIRHILGSVLGKQVIREGLAYKAARIEKLTSMVDSIDEVINSRKQYAQKLKADVVSLKAEIVRLENINFKTDEDHDKIENLKHEVAIIEAKLASGYGTGLINAKGAFDTNLIESSRKVLGDIADELGDITKNSRVEQVQVKKAYSEESLSLIKGK